MTRIEKCELAIEKGITYDPETGKVYGVRGKELKNKHKTGYLMISLRENKKLFNLRTHQFAWYWIHKEFIELIDHINGNQTDNRICNLRSVNNQQNMFNKTKSKGYSWVKKNKNWRAQIKLNRVSIHLGCFNTEEEARQAYLIAKEKYHII